MYAIVVGAGKVGRNLARELISKDHEVTLIEAGIEDADVFIASTDGDNTNLVIAQIAQRRFEIPRVIARVLDPARAAWYGEQGLETICPTQHAIELFERALETL